MQTKNLELAYPLSPKLIGINALSHSKIVNLAEISFYQMLMYFIIYLLERFNLRLPYLSTFDYPKLYPHDLAAEDSTIAVVTADAAPTTTSTAASTVDGATTDISSAPLRTYKK